MKEILIISSDKNALDIENVLRESFVCTVMDTAAAGLSYLKDEHDVFAILLDNPVSLTGVDELISYVNYQNNYISAIPIIVITDDKSILKNQEFLGDSVIDVVLKPVNPVILKLRVENAEKIISSVSFQEFAEMLKVLPANIYLKDSQGRYVFSSQTWHHLNIGNDPNWTIKGKTDLDIRKDKENAKKAMESDFRILENRKGTSYVIEEKDQGQEFLQIIKEPLFYEDGRVRGIIALINNVTEQELLRRELKSKSITDNLTGVYNRAYFEEYLQTLKDNIKYPLSVISADCDNLKMINDTYGHMVGDEYIRMSVTLMRTVMPDDCILFRTGGDEFVAFLQNTTNSEAGFYIEEMNRNARTYKLKGHHLSVSFGCGTLEEGAGTVFDIIKESDGNMYMDKKQKKNRRDDN